MQTYIFQILKYYLEWTVVTSMKNYETIESIGCKYLVKARTYRTLITKVPSGDNAFMKDNQDRYTAKFFTKLDKRKRNRKFLVSRILKTDVGAQISLFEEGYHYFFFISNGNDNKLVCSAIKYFDQLKKIYFEHEICCYLRFYDCLTKENQSMLFDSLKKAVHYNLLQDINLTDYPLFVRC